MFHLILNLKIFRKVVKQKIIISIYVTYFSFSDEFEYPNAVASLSDRSHTPDSTLTLSVDDSLSDISSNGM